MTKTLTHPAAEIARAALTAMEPIRAQAALESALEAEPSHPDLLCELAFLRLYSKEEAQAAKLFDSARDGARAALLAQRLAEHFFCLAESDPEDIDAQAEYVKFQAIHGHPLENVGSKLTACLIVKNESANLDRCLRSLRGVVDEIVVIDTGSTDDTLAIAERYDAKIGFFAWCDDFSAARNESLRLATGNWILWIDADEELAPGAARAILQATVRPQYVGFSLEIVNYTDDREGGNEFVHWPIRLFRNLPGVKFNERIHEQVMPSLAPYNLPWARLDGGQILHHGYRPQQVEEKGKVERTVGMLEAAVRENSGDYFQWFNLANALIVAKRFAEAEHAARTCIRLVEPGNSMGGLAYQLLTTALIQEDKAALALEVCDQADLARFGGILNEFERATALLKEAHYQEALTTVDRCLTLEWPQGMTGDRGIATHKRHILRGQILTSIGRHQEAIQMFDHALTVDPHYGQSWYGKAVALEQDGQLIQAIDAYERAFSDSDVSASATRGSARCRMTQGDTAGAAALYRKAWEGGFSDADAWIGWVQALEALGNVPALVDAYESFAQQHEPSVEVLINWGRTLEIADLPERALHCFTEAIRREPEHANAYFNCGDLLYRLGRHSDAAHIYEAGLRQNPANADGWFTLGNSLAQLGLNNGAITSYQQALTIAPNHGKARHNLEVLAA